MLKGINQKLILIVSNPQLSYRLTATFDHISPTKKDSHTGSPLFLEVKALEEELCDVSLKQHRWTCSWCCWKALGESDLFRNEKGLSSRRRCVCVCACSFFVKFWQCNDKKIIRCELPKRVFGEKKYWKVAIFWGKKKVKNNEVQ